MQSWFSKLLSESGDFELWMAVAQAACDLRWSSGIESLTRIQRLAMVAWVASGMIGNRGFFDHTPEEMSEWARVYDSLGIASAADAIRKAADIMPSITWNSDDPLEQKLDPLERQYYAANRDTERVVASLIREHPGEAFASLAEPRSGPVDGR